MTSYMTTEHGAPKRGEFVAVRQVEPMWICELEEEFVKVRDDEGFTLRIRTSRLSWDENAGMWGVASDIEEVESSLVNVEGDPHFNGAW